MMTGVGAVVLGVLVATVGAAAQTYDCDRLRQQLSTASRGDSGRAAQFARAAQRQAAELQRTQAYADQIGCDTGVFSIFGSDAPAQCDSIHAQITRMTNNLSALRDQAATMQQGDPSRQAALASQYQTYCATGGPSAGTGFDPDPEQTDDGAIRPGFGGSDDGVGEDGPRVHGGSKAVCVRTCDGGYFPLSFSGEQRNLDGLQALCTALCPNTEAKLYTTPNTDDIGSAVDLDGARYTDLPAAFKFQKTFTSTCTCKPANKSWVEALADAEKLLGANGSSDITVTAKMSDDMSRPGTDVPASPKKKSAKPARKSKLDLQLDADNALGAVGAQAPTASTESAGIVPDLGSTEKLLRTGEGSVQTVPGPDGASRRVRIISPRL